jgi:hypothetical protein
MLRKFILTIALCLLPLSFAATTFAAAQNPPPIIGGTLLPGVNAGISQQAGSNQGQKELNWIQTVFFKNTINKLIGWAAALAVVFLIIGGYQYLTAFGSDDQIKQAHKTITWSLVGVVLAMLAFAVVQIVVNLKFSSGAAGANLLAADAVSATYKQELEAIIPCFGSSCQVEEIAALPQGNFRDEFLPLVARFLIYAMGAVSFVIFFAAGAILVFSWGEEETTKKAKNAIVWGVTGIAFAAVSYILVKGLSEIDYMKKVTPTSVTTSQSTPASSTSAASQTGSKVAQECLNLANNNITDCKTCCNNYGLNSADFTTCQNSCATGAAAAGVKIPGEGGATCGGGKGVCKDYGTGWSGCWANFSTYEAGNADCRSERCCVQNSQ